MVAPHLIFSVTDAKPLSPCCVRASKTWNWLSRQVATILFISMSLRSNWTPHTPLLTLASQRTCRCLKCDFLPHHQGVLAATSHVNLNDLEPNHVIKKERKDKLLQCLTDLELATSRTDTPSRHCQIADFDQFSFNMEELYVWTIGNRGSLGKNRDKEFSMHMFVNDQAVRSDYATPQIPNCYKAFQFPKRLFSKASIMAPLLPGCLTQSTCQTCIHSALRMIAL
jgi:hypothetical protein